MLTFIPVELSPMSAMRTTYGTSIGSLRGHSFSRMWGIGQHHLIRLDIDLHTLRFMLRDERIWDKPGLFYPERFLDPSRPPPFEPQSIVFGFGRRWVWLNICIHVKAHRLSYLAEYVRENIWRTVKGSTSSRLSCGRSALTRSRARHAHDGMTLD